MTAGRSSTWLSRRESIAGSVSLFMVAGSARAAAPARVMVVACVHKLHLTNPHFTYQDLYDVVAVFRPDAVGVEIRQWDMSGDDAYLRHNYPAEMVHLREFYGSKAFGFDWLGEELAGRQIPNDWWSKQSRIKQLERAYGALPPPASPQLKAIYDKVDHLEAEQEHLAATASASELVDGRYDRITVAYNQAVAELVRGTQYEALATFTAARDVRIAHNIVAQVRARPEQRIAIVTGANHRGPVCRAIAALGASAELVQLATFHRTKDE